MLPLKHPNARSIWIPSICGVFSVFVDGSFLESIEQGRLEISFMTWREGLCCSSKDNYSGINGPDQASSVTRGCWS